MTDPPDTPRLCIACGGRTSDCRWCTAGLQTRRQTIVFARHRIGERKLSSTSAMVEELLLAVVAKLDDAGHEVLAEQGIRLHALWSDAQRSDRAALSQMMSRFIERALDTLGEDHRPTDPSPRDE